MPYLTEKNKKEVENIFLHADNLYDFGNQLKTAGEINYAITKLIQGYFKAEGKGNYQSINDIVGALDGAKVEFQRRTVAPYEDSKIKINGDA